MRKQSSTNYENETKLYGNCGVAYAFKLIGGRWKACILFEIITPKRFSELKSNIDGISERVLARQLKALEQDNLLQKKTSGLNHKYELTELGRTLIPVLSEVSNWGVSQRPNN